MKISLLNSNDKSPLQLLLTADPSEKKIRQYLEDGLCFICKHEEEIIGVMVLKKNESDCLEIKNLAVLEDHQGTGIGRSLLEHAHMFALEKGYTSLMIATADTSERQLNIYNNANFELHKIEKDFFINAYEKPIFENGMQCRDKIILIKKLS